MNGVQKIIVIGGGALTARMAEALIAACKKDNIAVSDSSCLNRNHIPYYETEESDVDGRVPETTYEMRQVKKWEKNFNAMRLWCETAEMLDKAKTKLERRRIVKGYKNQRRILRLQHAGAQLTRIHECTFK